MELLIGGISASALIVAMIEALKAVGLPGQYARWMNGVLSVIAYIVIILVDQGQLDIQVVTWAVMSIAVFLGAAGFYDLTWPALDRLSGRER